MNHHRSCFLHWSGWKVDLWCFYIPAAPGALEALCHRGGPAGYRHPVPYDLADCGPLAHHSGGKAALRPIRDCVFTNMTQLELLCFATRCIWTKSWINCFSFSPSRSSLKKHLKGTWISWLSLFCSTAVQRRWTHGLVRIVLGLTLNLFTLHPILIRFFCKMQTLHFIS